MHKAIFGHSRVTRHAVTVTRFTASIYFVSSAALIIFGVSVPPVWQGLLGMLVSMEGFYGAMSLDLHRIRLFMVGLAVGSILSLVFGVLALRGHAFVECTVNLDELELFDPIEVAGIDSSSQDCLSAVQLYAQVQLFSAAAIAVLLLVFIFPAYRQIRRGVLAASLNRKEKELECFLHDL
mmetsp:Transcript_4732/g.5461  ORF Transcript_4732/g.5461 Transcript_4732/m.5461 type:complete len:180 (-) Transcript_4732:902-1441(-)